MGVEALPTVVGVSEEGLKEQRVRRGGKSWERRPGRLSSQE